MVAVRITPGDESCLHTPQCMDDPRYCWPADYVAAFAADLGDDAVRVAGVRSAGLAARVHEHLDQARESP